MGVTDSLVLAVLPHWLVDDRCRSLNTSACLFSRLIFTGRRTLGGYPPPFFASTWMSAE